MHPIHDVGLLVGDGLVASPAVPLSMVTRDEGGLIGNLDHIRAQHNEHHHDDDMGGTVTDRRLIFRCIYRAIGLRHTIFERPVAEKPF